MANDIFGYLKDGAPGLFDLGTGIFARNQAEQEARKRLQQAQGPLYDQANAGAKTALDLAGGIDPKVHAAERLAAEQGLLAGKDAADEDALMRMLYSRGMLGAATFNPGVEGITPNGVAMNPQMAAFYAARNARNAKMAQDSLKSGEEYLDRTIARSGTLQKQAADRQSTGLAAQRTQPSRATGTAELLKGAGSFLKESGLLGAGVDWLRDWWKGSPGYAGGMFGLGSGGEGWQMADWGSNEWSW